MTTDPQSSSLLPQRLPWEGSYNARDLGGYPTAAGSVIQPRRLVRSDTLYHLTAHGQQAMLDWGIRSMIDLRSAEEVQQWPHAFMCHDQIQYWSIPLSQSDDPEIQTQLEQAPLYQWNFLVLAHAQPQIARILQQIATAPAGGVLIHCHAGKDRTGLISAILLALLGVAPDLIIRDYMVSASYLQPLYQPWLEAVAHDPVQLSKLQHDLSSAPETMRDVLAAITQHYGGIHAYVRQCGLAQDTIVQLEQRLCRM